MLQSINPSVQVSLSGSAVETLPAGFAEAQAGSGQLQAFDLQLALHGFSAAEASTPLEQDPVPAKAPLVEADAEQWLAGMLGQQAVRVEAREVPEQPEQAQPTDDIRDPQAVPLAAVLLPQHEPAVVAPAPALEGLSEARQPAPAMQRTTVMTLPLAAEGTGQLPSPLALTDEAPEVLERLPGAVESDKPAAGGAPATQAGAQPLTAERSLKLPVAQAQWGEQMLHSLREQVELQINQRIQNATIRLDPPELGSLEIFLSHESGRLNVQLSAANGEVARLLQQISERLRQELVGQNFVQVNVQVSADAQGGRQQQQAQAQRWLVEDEVAAAVALPASGERNGAQSTSDVLVTV
uniref:Flagellar hook-length control protein n=1 Tax=Ectopseudomonas mendocina (strain ymp) TaxID=399739 RepID=A4XNP7_ECTM1